MCKMCDFFRCCCCCGNRTKRKKRSGRDGKTASTQKYGTDWHTQVDIIDDPTQIDDFHVTKQLVMNKNFENRVEWYNEVLRQEGSNYVIFGDKELGHGAFGKVWKIRHTETGEFFALKMIHVNVGPPNQRDTNRFQMFKREIFALIRAQHKNVIRLVKHFMVDTAICFLIMELAEGGDLKNRLHKKYNELNERQQKYQCVCDDDEAKTYFVQVANAMYFVHSRRWVHGDLKLENILITRQGDREVIKVSDFGCARVGYREGRGPVAQEKAVGTVPYMSPEQLKVYITSNLGHTKPGQKAITNYNPMRSDVWALGICLYRMFTYESPFNYNQKNQVKSCQQMIQQMRNLDLPRKMRVTAEARDLLRGLLEYDRKSRLDMLAVMIHPWIKGHELLDKVVND